MASRDQGPVRSILGMIGAGVAAGCALVVLVTTPAWSTISGLLGVGDPSASLEDAVALRGGPVQASPDARTPAQWWALIAGRAAATGGADAGTIATPDGDPAAGAGAGGSAAAGNGADADAASALDAAGALALLDSIPATDADATATAYDLSLIHI